MHVVRCQGACSDLIRAEFVGDIDARRCAPSNQLSRCCAVACGGSEAGLYIKLRRFAVPSLVRVAIMLVQRAEPTRTLAVHPLMGKTSGN